MPFGIAVSTACWLFGAGPGLNDDFDTSSVHSPGITLGVWAMANEEPTTTNAEASSKCFMRTIIVAAGSLSNDDILPPPHARVLFGKSTVGCFSRRARPGACLNRNVRERSVHARRAQRVQDREKIDAFLQD